MIWRGPLLFIVVVCFALGLCVRDASSQEAPQTELPNTEAKSDQEASGPTDDDIRLRGLIASVTIFVLAIFVGFEVITKVPPTLHTPLMSGSNAISGITIVGALIAAGTAGGFASFVGMLAVALAVVNVVGGFMVTQRMLSKFKKQ